ncbi:MAG: tRNA (adenosine(37)-N6)-threonylcarbamoyltransferase complex ATPase subunit type 1 TsaE [Clostridia bacterium]|nr:tRNA (adenosine(37)-N6)-threonylcarbamoyltransferase complex ATPase subunit type 1 TsaE [Clostridia bacterium]
MKYIVNSVAETHKLAQKFAASLSKGDVVLLHGDLGAGKTTFTQGVFAALGVKEIVNSPTFAILKSYQGKNCVLHHFDTYRISTEEAIESGFDEILDDRQSIIFIEWSENILPLLPNKTKNVNIKLIDENTREFNIDE